MSTVKQKQFIITVEPAEAGGETRRIVGHRMPWKAQRAFLQKFAVVVADIIRAKGAGEVALRERILGNLPALVTSSDELISILCLGSTELKLDEFDALDTLAAMEVLRLSLEVNFDEETKNSFAGIVERLAALMPADPTKTTSSATSTPTC